MAKWCNEKQQYEPGHNISYKIAYTPQRKQIIRTVWSESAQGTLWVVK